ncbi:DUF6370 family protein [Pedobacter sp. SL55]|uniref:DUF6370 family protein n=1 Tax=Pedobacter sp. SL55 TaxID=2995161 RepID=UPI00226EF447|nr:DUF6370 family protein [Pedobacter sp. SL55]WAC40471.1 DUF6370 family protein [Pedobacter sp. SL55]
MKKTSLFILFTLLTYIVNAQETPSKTTKIEKKKVEIACGECMFKMDGKGCDLAIRIDGKPYFVDGRKIDDFGDAHADDGFCNAIRKATVTGEIVNGRFKAKSIQLVETKKTEKPKS